MRKNKQDIMTPNDAWRDDWRLMGQEGYLMRAHLQHRKFDRSICIEDFDQCDFLLAFFR